MKTRESLIVAVITISMFSIFYLTVPPNPNSFKMPNPKSEHRKVQDRLEQPSSHQEEEEDGGGLEEKKENKNQLSVINIEECNCNR